MQYVCKITKSASAEDIKKIYQSVDWYEDSWGLDGLAKIAENSAIFVGAYNESNQLIGMGRVLSDNVSDACIQDVAVLSEYQGLGIGKAIVELLLKECKNRGIDWIQLVATNSGRGFYKKLGFSIMENHYPMKFQ